LEHGKKNSAGFLNKGAGGGSYTCCLTIPLEWRPGLFVTVTYATFSGDAEKKVAHVVAIPKYDGTNVSTMNVHFLRNGTVKVFVTRIMLGHRDYPLKGKEAELKPGVPIKIQWP
jgi:hypothetical protein